MTKPLDMLRNPKWVQGFCGWSLMDGFNKRAVIVPMTPRKWNGRNRWIVDAIGLNGPQYAATMQDAMRIAEEHC